MYQDDHIHLNYCGNLYLLSPIGGFRYGKGEHIQDTGVTVFESVRNLMNNFVEGEAHINLSDDVVCEMSKEEVNMHILRSLWPINSVSRQV